MTERRTFLRKLTLVATVAALRPATSLFADESAGEKNKVSEKKSGRLGAAEFSRCHGSTFQVRDAGWTVSSLVLTDVQSRSRGAKLESFQLRFSGPAAGSLSERTYCFVHPELGEFDVYIQPRRVVDGARYYSAIFCRLA